MHAADLFDCPNIILYFLEVWIENLSLLLIISSPADPEQMKTVKIALSELLVDRKLYLEVST